MASGVVSRARGGRAATWDRESVIVALRRYVELYGDEPMTAAAFSPSTAKWRDEEWLAERYYEGDPDGIGPWPSLNGIKRFFNGSFNEARVAAGLEPNRPGPAKRRAAGAHRPVRDVSHAKATRTVFVEKVSDEARVRGLEQRLERAERRADRLDAALERSRASKRARTVTKTKTTTKTLRVTDDAAVARVEKRAESSVARAEGKVAKAERKLADARVTVDGLRRDLSEARTAAARLASRLERSEATVNTLRAERRELKAAADGASDAATAAKTMLRDAERAVEAMRAETRVVVRDAPEQAQIDAARIEAREARVAQRDAEVRAARAEREYRELAAAARGEERKLTKAELDEFRVSGPTGPALLAAALGELASVRKAGGNKTALRGALRKVASAAVSWMDRL